MTIQNGKLLKKLQVSKEYFLKAATLLDAKLEMPTCTSCSDVQSQCTEIPHFQFLSFASLLCIYIKYQMGILQNILHILT